MRLNRGAQEFRFRTAPVVVRNVRVLEVILLPVSVQRSSSPRPSADGFGDELFLFLLRGKTRRVKGGEPDR